MFGAFKDADQMESAIWQARELAREQIMEKQVIANTEPQDAIVADKRLTIPQGLARRMKDAISTNIGLYEIRVNLFLWGLFRTTSQKDS